MNRHIQDTLKEFEKDNEEALLVGLTAILIDGGIHGSSALSVDKPAKVAKRIYDLLIKQALEDIYQKGREDGVKGFVSYVHKKYGTYISVSSNKGINLVGVIKEFLKGDKQ